MSKIAIITARGGSKRIPKKNIKTFIDRPIIAYSIEAAIKSGVFDEVMVSTDSEEIARVAKQYGATVPFFRSNENANDFATTADVILEVLESYKQKGREFEQLCCIYPTAPFITADIIREGMELLTKEKADSVLPVVAFSFPPQRSVVIKDGKLEPRWPECMPMRSQDLEPFYHDCGQFYCLNTDAFYAQKKLVMKHTRPLIMDEMNVQDIDNETDWKLAELKFQLRNG